MRPVRTLARIHGERQQLQPVVEGRAGTLGLDRLNDARLASCRSDSIQPVEILDHQQPASIHRVEQFASQSGIRPGSFEGPDDRFLPIHEISRTRNAVARLLYCVTRRNGHVTHTTSAAREEKGH